MPGHFQGRQQLGPAYPDRGRLELAAVSAREPALALVCDEDGRAVSPDPTHHAGGNGPQARGGVVAICRDRADPRGCSDRSRGPGHDPRIAPRISFQNFGSGEDPERGLRVPGTGLAQRVPTKSVGSHLRSSGRACRIVASRHGAAGYKLMRRAHDCTLMTDLARTRSEAAPQLGRRRGVACPLDGRFFI